MPISQVCFKYSQEYYISMIIGGSFCHLLVSLTLECDLSFKMPYNYNWQNFLRFLIGIQNGGASHNQCALR